VVVFSPVPALFAAETNSATRTRDDKSSSMVNLALQVVQQLQSQQQTNLHAIAEVREKTESSSRQTAASVASLRRLTLAMGLLLAGGLFALFLYERRLFCALQQRMQLAMASPAPGSPRLSSPAFGALASQFVARGQVLLNQRQAAAAIACFEQAIALEPGHAEAYIRKGLAFEQLDRFGDALASFDHALALNPMFADAYVGKGDVLNRLERYEEALACFDQATRLQFKPAVPGVRPHPEAVTGPS
jgi:tetratricopeptide (TPR) repeat protein